MKEVLQFRNLLQCRNKSEGRFGREMVRITLKIKKPPPCLTGFRGQALRKGRFTRYGSVRNEVATACKFNAPTRRRIGYMPHVNEWQERNDRIAIDGWPGRQAA